MRHQRLWLRASLLAPLVAFSFARAAASNLISQATARNLIRDALVAVDQNPKAFHIESIHSEYAPDFYSFSAAWYNPDGPALVLYFALNSATGDVWDTVMCRRITSPAIRKEQELIRAKLKATAEARKRLETKSPGCSEERRETTEKPK